MRAEADTAAPALSESSGQRPPRSSEYRRFEGIEAGVIALPPDWEKRNFIALDFETTGLDARTDRVVEIGLIQFGFDAEGAVRESEALSLLVHPGMPIPPQATAIHGIHDLDVSFAPSFRDLVAKVEALLAERVIVAHNAPFDVGFLKAEFGRAGSALPVFPSLDTVTLARKAFPGLPSYSLGALARHFGIDMGSAHRALDDARSCMGLFCRCARRLSE